jgi:hypothetical protein
MIKHLLLAATIFTFFLCGCSGNADPAKSDSEKKTAGHMTTAVNEGQPQNTPPEYQDFDKPVKKPGMAAGKMEPSITYKEKNGQLIFTFTIKNQTAHLYNFRFESSQQLDYVIKGKDSPFIKQYSKEHTFSKMPTSAPIKPGGTLSYDVTVTGLPKGDYTITFILTDKELKPKATLSFTVK